ncbi:SNF5-domain-containing protein [Atractiella rhizophila]|nr:SNF5-domain-containing protein [Atractiella rhizophila]
MMRQDMFGRAGNPSMSHHDLQMMRQRHLTGNNQFGHQNVQFPMQQPQLSASTPDQHSLPGIPRSSPIQSGLIPNGLHLAAGSVSDGMTSPVFDSGKTTLADVQFRTSGTDPMQVMIDRTLNDLQAQMNQIQNLTSPSILDSLKLASATASSTLPIHEHFTAVTATDDSDLKSTTLAEDQQRLREWMARDLAYERDVKEHISHHKAEFTKVLKDSQQHQDWLGRDTVPGKRYNTSPTRIRLPQQWAKEKVGRKRQNRPLVKLDGRKLDALAAEEEILVPIRLDIQHDNLSLRDTFTWNLKETAISIEDFATHLIVDLQVPKEHIHHFYNDVVSTIKQQLDDFKVREDYYINFNAKRPRTDEERLEFSEDEKWWTRWRKRLKVGSGSDAVPGGATEVMTMGSDALREFDNQEFRINVKIDITVDNLNLKDQFDWDLGDALNVPEHLAELYTADLGLPGEFTTAVAHSIREQAEIYVKSLFLIGHIEGDIVRDDDLRASFLPPITDVFRSEVSDYSPQLQTLSLKELEHNERERERQTRRTRRQTRGRNRATVLPDRDFIPTHRVPVPKPGGSAPPPIPDSNGDMISLPPELAIAFEIVKGFKEIAPKSTRESSPPRSRFGASKKDGLEGGETDSLKLTPLKKVRQKNLISQSTDIPTPASASEISASVPIVVDAIVEEHASSDNGSPAFVPSDSIPNIGSVVSLEDHPQTFTGHTSETASTAACPDPLVEGKQEEVTAQPSTEHEPLVASTSVDESVQGAGSSSMAIVPPQWLLNCVTTLRSAWPNDRFETVPKPNLPDGWRIRCNDCPGNLYNVGPEESLTNFEVHLRNRSHRLNIQNRLDKSNQPSK